MKCFKGTISFILLLLLFVVSCSACTGEAMTENEEKEILTIIEDGQEVEVKNGLDIIRNMKAELEINGWEHINTTKGHLDYMEWTSLWGAIIEPDEKEKDMNLYTMVGRHIDESDRILYVIVKIVFTEENAEGKIYDVMYISESGRNMESSFLNTLELLPPNNKNLQEYMYSY